MDDCLGLNLKEVLNSLPIAIFIVAKNYNIVAGNDEFLKILGENFEKIIK